MDTRIKERLTGALILVAALVILVPEIFSGRHAGAPAREAPVAAPASEGPPLRTYTAELSATKPAPTTPAAPTTEPPPVVAPPPVTETKPAHEERPAVRETKLPAPVVAAPTPTPPPAPKLAAGGDWFVQVGSFSQAENAERYAQQLRKQGFSAFVLPPAGPKALSRVRVGPARSREAAAALLERLIAGGHKGAVVGP